jgi:hypothetical protein
VLTTCGLIDFERPWHHCRACRQGFSPTDLTLGIKSRERLSAELRAWLVELGAETAFDQAASRLTRLTGLWVSGESVRKQTERVGYELEETQEKSTAQVERTQEPAEALDKAPGELVVQTDGVMIRYLDGWHEVKLGLVAGQVDGKLERPSYLAQRAAPDKFGKRLLAEAARRGALEIIGWEGGITGRGIALLRRVIVLGDGAPWIWNLASDCFGDRVEILDYYHATEHIWKLANTLYGEGSNKAGRWAKRQCGRVLTRGVEGLLRALRAIRRCRPEAKETLRRERGYFLTNRVRMGYPSFKEQGLPIGSGAVESAARHLVQQRMKLSGARWSKAGAQAVLNVRCHILSNRPIAC